ncbi:hypothetical protein FJM01_00655 [Mycoplasma struthionis]|uniref:Uncharacterized protein n=1 Tax=Mycoplasma struthionis TaxID=538220 RepID=A0A502M2V1_9MOLU|nr:hypothetical protein [Mycoplasma struthionis]TPI02482.1 hypothetical protein FJM01_00655 [Mycoplasma struthionis]
MVLKCFKPFALSDLIKANSAFNFSIAGLSSFKSVASASLNLINDSIFALYKVIPSSKLSWPNSSLNFFCNSASDKVEFVESVLSAAGASPWTLVLPAWFSFEAPCEPVSLPEGVFVASGLFTGLEASFDSFEPEELPSFAFFSIFVLGVATISPADLLLSFSSTVLLLWSSFVESIFLFLVSLHAIATKGVEAKTVKELKVNNILSFFHIYLILLLFIIFYLIITYIQIEFLEIDLERVLFC